MCLLGVTTAVPVKALAMIQPSPMHIALTIYHLSGRHQSLCPWLPYPFFL